jgi:hypothetical protein
MSSPNPQMIFVSSDLRDPDQCDREILEWTARNGYMVQSMDRIYTAYRDAEPIRTWRLAEVLPN